MQDELGFADKADTRAAAGTGWTPAELNHILNAHVPCGGRRLDNLWMCGMGVTAVQGHDACQMLSL